MTPLQFPHYANTPQARQFSIPAHAAIPSAASLAAATAFITLLWGAFCASAASAQPATQPADLRTWEVRGHTLVPLENPTTAPVQPDPMLDRVEELLQNHQPTRARKQALLWIRTHKGSPWMDRALFLFGEANFRYGDRHESFYDFDELMDKFPESRYYQRALERQYDIADAYLNGYKNRFLGIPLFTDRDTGIEMLYRIQQRSPGSPLAEKALLRTANYYYQNRQYDIAVDAMAVFLRSYPRSPSAPVIRLNQAFANLAQFHGANFDVTPLIDGRAQIEEIKVRDPQIAAAENLDSTVTRIDDTLAHKILLTANYYQRTHHPDAAVYNLRYLVQAYPDSPDAAVARNMLSHMPAKLLAAPPPPPGRGYASTTAPSLDR